jgi:hypothetical protein
MLNNKPALIKTRIPYKLNSINNNDYSDTRSQYMESFKSGSDNFNTTFYSKANSDLPMNP